MPRVDGGELTQRPDDPFAQHARAHRGAGRVEHREQGRLRPLARRVERSDQLEIHRRGFIEQQIVFGILKLDAPDVRQIAAQLRAYIMEHGACGAQAERRVFAAEPFERVNLKVAQQRVRGVVGFKRPVLADGLERVSKDWIDQIVLHRNFGNDALLRAVARQIAA